MSKKEALQSAADEENIASPETYVGYDRAESFSSPGGFARDASKVYAAAIDLQRNQWALAGSWMVSPESAVLDAPGGRLSFRFHARDLHLVLGPGKAGKPIRFRVTLDGQAPGKDGGVDAGASGDGVLSEQRLYQLIRQSEDVRDRTFTIEFLDAGAEAFAFTFG